MHILYKFLYVDAYIHSTYVFFKEGISAVTVAMRHSIARVLLRTVVLNYIPIALYLFVNMYVCLLVIRSEIWWKENKLGNIRA